MKLTYEQWFWRTLEHWAIPKLNNLKEWIDFKRQIADLKSDRIKKYKKED